MLVFFSPSIIIQSKSISKPNETINKGTSIVQREKKKEKQIKGGGGDSLDNL